MGNLNLPGLGDAATLAHVVPDLAHSSLLSIKQLCDNGCHVLFTKQDCKVYRKAELMLVGKRHPATGLWVVPTNSQPISTTPPSAFASHAAHNAYQTTSKAKLIQFLHQCAFSPPPSTWIKAINNNQFATWPGLTADAIRWYLPDSPATAKGHMKKTPAGVRSTRTTHNPTNQRQPSTSPPSPPPNHDDLFPPHESNTINHIFCWAALADQIEGTTYTDLTGRFPTMSLENKQYIFIAYDYTTNAIIVRALTDRESSTIVKAFDDIFTYLAAKGFKPQFNVLDNEASHAITEYLRQQNIKWQFVPPNEHCVNAAERAIQTFKNHLIAGLCSTDRDFPSQLWDKLLPQAQDSLNMLRTSRIDPTKSVYENLEGAHEPATTRTSWGPRGTDAWYIGPAMHHYRSYEFYVPETRSYRISASAKFFPSYCDLPTESPIEAAARTAAELLIKLRQQRDPQDPTQLSRHQRAIKIINDIYHLNSQQAPRVNTQTSPPPRVEPTLSSNPTAPRILRTTPRLHTRVTRRNTPGLTTEPTPPRRSPRLNPYIPNTSMETAPTPPSPLPSQEPTRNTPVAPAQPLQPNPPTPDDGNHHTSSSPTLTFTDEDDDSVVIPISSIPMDKHPPVHVQIPHFISQDALHAFACHASTPSTSNLFLPKWRQPTAIPHLEHFANPVVHPTSGKTISKYEELANDPFLRDTWTTAFGKELGALAQGDNKTGAAGTNTIFFLDHKDILNIPSDRTITYARVVVDYRPQKEDPNRVRITVGGNLIDYPGELTTRTADLVTSKILWNSIISTPSARYLTADLKLFYLTAPLDRYEYMRIPLKIIPTHIIDQYDLRAKAKNGFVYMEIRRAMYGLPQAGILANKLLKQRLAKYGYYEVAHTPGLWKHLSRPISFTLVVDDFGIKYVGKEHADHLLNALKQHYTLDIDWTGSLYCGIALKWDYHNKTVDISMPGYIKKVLQRFQHKCSKPQHSPYQCAPKQYGKSAQLPLPPDDSPPLSKPGITRIQQIVGAILYYAQCVDITILMTLSTIVHEQARATERTNLSVTQLLDYCVTHLDAATRFRASDMVLNIHSDASYLNAPSARSRVGGHFFLGWSPHDRLPMKLNGTIHVISTILKFVAASATEAELGALFVNAKEGRS